MFSKKIGEFSEFSYNSDLEIISDENIICGVQYKEESIEEEQEILILNLL